MTPQMTSSTLLLEMITFFFVIAGVRLMLKNFITHAGRLAGE